VTCRRLERGGGVRERVDSIPLTRSHQSKEAVKQREDVKKHGHDSAGAVVLIMTL
jgi:hypothetical protein